MKILRRQPPGMLCRRREDFMKKMYAILAAVILTLAALVIFVVIDNNKKNAPKESTTVSTEAESETESTTEKETETTESTEATSSILPSLSFTSAEYFQAAKVVEVTGKDTLTLEYYDTEKEEAKLLDDVRQFDFTPFSSTGEIDDEYHVFSFTYIYNVVDGQYYAASVKDIEAGDMILDLHDYSGHYYILIYKQG